MHDGKVARALTTISAGVEPDVDPKKQHESDLKAGAGYNHTPGLRHTLRSDGTTYDVDDRGAWHRITPRSCAKHGNLKNHSVARRARRGVV